MTSVRRRSGLLGSNLDADSSNNLYVRAAESDNYVWDTGSLTWVKMTQPGSGGGGAVTIADGADVTQGAKADTAWVSGSGSVIALLKTIASGGGGGSGPVTIVNGGDVAEGSTTDAAVITDTTGTLSGKLRGLVKHAYERMPAALGQTTMAASLSVALASDQTSFPVTVAAGTAVIGHVIVDSGTVTTVATVSTITNVVHVDDNAGSLTVDGTVALSAGSAVIGHVITDATSVTNATLSAETTKVIGTVNQGTSPWVVSGAVTLASTAITATVNPAGVASVVGGRQVVTTAGTAVQLSAQACKSVAITAETDNTGVVVLGDSGVIAALATRKGTPLSAGDTAICAVSNMSLLYADSTVSGDGVTWMVLS